MIFASCGGEANFAKDIIAFSIDGNVGVISGTGITVTVPSGTNLTSLTPTIEVSEGSTVSPSNGGDYRASYWKNGARTVIGDPGIESFATSIYVITNN